MTDISFGVKYPFKVTFKKGLEEEMTSHYYLWNNYVKHFILNHVILSAAV